MNTITGSHRSYGFALFVILFFSSCYAIRAYKFRKLNITDHERLPSLPVQEPVSHYQYKEAYLPPANELSQWLDKSLDSSYTAAFLVIRNDSILYEKYFAPSTKESLLPSYSVIKTFTGTLTGIAAKEGKIKSLQDPVTNYIPELLKNDQRFANITIQHLLDMRSGIRWNEGSYGLKDDAIKMAFRPNMMKYVKKLKIDSAPGKDSSYKSINTMLLGIVVTRATGMPLNEYLQQKIWQPLGMESRATLNTDKRHMPIAYAGLNATARDYAKLGSLFLKKGNWEGKQIVSAGWVNASVSKDSMFAYNGYRNQWWGVDDYKYFTDSLQALDYKSSHQPASMHSYIARKDGKKYFSVAQASSRYYAEGILGQFIYVNPDKNLVIVRLGHYWNSRRYSLEGLLEETQKRF